MKTLEIIRIGCYRFLVKEDARLSRLVVVRQRVVIGYATSLEEARNVAEAYVEEKRGEIRAAIAEVAS